MNPIPYIRTGLLVGLLSTSLSALAEDIDIYDGNNNQSMTPNILLMLDNGANFTANADQGCAYEDGSGTPSLGNTTGGIEQCALYNALLTLETNADGSAKINIGFMVFNHSKFNSLYSCNSSGNGGCLVKPITPMTAANKAAWLTWIKSWSKDNLGSSGDRTAATVQEGWAYFSGNIGLSGTDYASVKPVNTGCQSNYLIYIGNAWNTSGTPGDSGNASPASALTNAPGITEAQKLPIEIPSGRYGTISSPNQCGSYSMRSHNEGKGHFADEWSRYMYQTDLSGVYGGENIITTYTIGLLGDKCVPDYPALMKSMATYGGGRYFPTSNYEELSTALLRIFNEVQAVNSVFSSSSLPVSVNTQGTYLNQVYMGMFRPDREGRPRWMGNLKQYQFRQDTVTRVVELADSTGAAAISSAGTGFITPDAISFWTTKDVSAAPDSTGGFWVNDPQGIAQDYDSPDGEVVEKGGAAQWLRNANLTTDYAAVAGSSTNPRKMYVYCPSGASCASQLSDSTNIFAPGNSAITATALGVADVTERTKLINWIRGEDNVRDAHGLSDEKGPGGAVTVRPSIHADVLHSRPVVISYGGDPEQVVVFYGSNDGVFHAVNGNQTTAINSVPAGHEMWSLVLPEFLGKLKRQRDNWPLLDLSTTEDELNPEPKDYFVDGPTGFYQQLNEDGTTAKAYIYLTMRRGGRFIYALDVTNPSDPRVLWKKSASDSGMGELGQTWSRPRLALVKGYADSVTGKAKPVLIFGGGYSTTQDSEPPIADTMGRGVFILDATTGARVWSAGPSSDGNTSCAGTTVQASCSVAGMDYSIPADIAMLDRDYDGYIERLYASDLGGNVWRIDLEPTAGNTPDHWQAYKFAALGCNITSGTDTGVCPSGTAPRKFFFPPSIVSVGVAGTLGSYDVLAIGSGDREHPLYSDGPNSAYMVTNRLYALKDTVTGKDGSGRVPIIESALDDATTLSYDPTGGDSGYYITLMAGEKAVNAPLTVSGVTHFGTNQPIQPTVGSCTNSLGVARIRSVNIFTGSKNISVLDGGGLPPSPVSGIVTIDGRRTGFCIGCGTPPPDSTGNTQQTSCKSALDANCFTDVDGAKKLIRTYWYKK